MMTRALTAGATLILAITVWASAWAAASQPVSPTAAGAKPTAAPLQETACDGGHTAPTRVYLIECKLVETAPGGKPRILASPVLMTVEGRPASVRVGREVPPPRDCEMAEGPFEGLLCEVKVFRTKRGQTFVDAELQASWIPANAKTDGVRLVNVGARIIEAVTLGEWIGVPFGNGDEQSTARRFEMMVKEAGDKPAATAAGTLPDKPPHTATRPRPSAAAR